MAAGIVTRHSKTCRSREGARCSCKPTFEAWVYDAKSKKKIRRPFKAEAAAKSWRRDAARAVDRGELQPSSGRTLDEAATEWFTLARRGVVRNRSGAVYKPAAIRAYQQTYRLRIKEEFGHRRLSDVSHFELQDFVDRLIAKGLSPSTVGVAVLPLRAIYKRNRREIPVNPTTGLQMPAIEAGRDRIASPDEAARLLDALPAADRALWATAMYAGLRRGELMALRWEDVDLAGGKIRVERSWDQKEGEVAPKSRQGKRTVPIAAVLRDYLLEHRMAQGDEATGLVFGLTPISPFRPTALRERANKAWGKAEETRRAAVAAGTLPKDSPEIQRITLHECRHTFASLMIAAGVNAKALSTYMGHSSIQVTFDRYGHLMPGNEEEAANLLDGFLADHAAAQARKAAASTPEVVLGA